MMAGIKVVLFAAIIVAVRFIFSAVTEAEDKKLRLMRELADFTEYLRAYSCGMKLPYDEILDNYSFRLLDARRLCIELHSIISGECSSLTLLAPDVPEDYLREFRAIGQYYGNTMSDVLDMKLSFTYKELEKKREAYENTYQEKKTLYNKISVLSGCLVAIILI